MAKVCNSGVEGHSERRTADIVSAVYEAVVNPVAEIIGHTIDDFPVTMRRQLGYRIAEVVTSGVIETGRPVVPDRLHPGRMRTRIAVLRPCDRTPRCRLSLLGAGPLLWRALGRRLLRPLGSLLGLMGTLSGALCGGLLRSLGALLRALRTLLRLLCSLSWALITLLRALGRGLRRLLGVLLILIALYI